MVWVSWATSSFQFSEKAGSGDPRRGWKLEEMFWRFESSGVFTPWFAELNFWKMFFMSREILFLP